MNLLGKTLVLLHAILSISAMTWAILLALQARDFGWMEPYREVVEWTKDGNEKTAVRYASEYDKSTATATRAARNRDLAFVFVKPALDTLRETEPHLAANHLYFTAKLAELKDANVPIQVKRLANAGLKVDTPLSKPDFDAAVEGVDQSLATYSSQRKKLLEDIDKVESEVRTIATKTKKITGDLTGTDDGNKYVQPGLYQLTDLEYKTQVQLKVEIDQLKPHWSEAIEHARLYRDRYDGLLATLKKLQAVAPKDDKK
jgi:hypothetical protein